MYKVKRALILAAGRGMRLLPVTKETAKPLIDINGTIIIEDIIKKLKEKGIKKITVLTGYKHKKFKYLKSKFKVKIKYNFNWRHCNNIGTLYFAKNKLKNALIVNGDTVLKENIFEQEFPHTLMYGEKINGVSNEWTLTVNQKTQQITKIKKSGGVNIIAQREVTFIGQDTYKKIRKSLKKYRKSIDMNDWYFEDIIINDLKSEKPKIKIYCHLVKKNSIFDVDNLDDLKRLDSKYKKYNQDAETKALIYAVKKTGLAPEEFDEIKSIGKSYICQMKNGESITLSK